MADKWWWRRISRCMWSWNCQIGFIHRLSLILYDGLHFLILYYRLCTTFLLYFSIMVTLINLIIYRY